MDASSQKRVLDYDAAPGESTSSSRTVELRKCHDNIVCCRSSPRRAMAANGVLTVTRFVREPARRRDGNGRAEQDERGEDAGGRHAGSHRAAHDGWTVAGGDRRPGGIRPERAHQGGREPSRRPGLRHARARPVPSWRGRAGRRARYDDLPTALSLMGELRDDGIVEDVGAAIAYLEGQKSLQADRIGITGFCMGSRVSYLAACALPGKIRAAVPFYGGGIPVDRTATLQAPVLALFGGDDPFIPPEQVRALEAEAKRLGKSVEVHVYPGAPHGFFCNERDWYRPDAAADAWRRLTTFLATHLKG